jgi:hypothetical protein
VCDTIPSEDRSTSWAFNYNTGIGKFHAVVTSHSQLNLKENKRKKGTKDRERNKSVKHIIK